MPIMGQSSGEDVATHPSRWWRRWLGAAALLPAVGGVVLFLSRPAANPSTPDEAIGLSSTASRAYVDLGKGKCVLADGGPPKFEYKGSGEVYQVEDECTKNAHCKGFSASSSGGGLLWLSGPLIGGGAEWGHCHCFVKRDLIIPAPSPPHPTAQPAPPAGAGHDGAVPFPNMRMVTMGYNLFMADPLPIFPEGTMPQENNPVMDPGLKLPLFKIEYTQGTITGDGRHTIPDGYHATVDEGCSTAFTTKTIRDSYEYQTEQTQTMSVSRDVKVAVTWPPSPGSKMKGAKSSKSGKGPKFSVGPEAFAGGGGALSYQFRDIQENNRLRDQKMYRSSAKCSAYVAAYSYSSPPKSDPDFATHVGLLGDRDYMWYAHFDKYGTHMLTTIKMGARYGSSMFVENSKVSEMRKNANGFGLGIRASVGASVKMGVSYKKMNLGKSLTVEKKWERDMITPQERAVGSKMKDYFTHKTTSIVGPPLPTQGAPVWVDMVRKNPVPIAFELELICMHPEIAKDEGRFNSCEKYLTTYCEEYLTREFGISCLPPKEKECYNDLDCEEDFVCRNWHCLPVPKCQATFYDDKNFQGGKYTTQAVTSIKHSGGWLYNMEQENWVGRVTSLKLSDGCLRAELIDNDFNCVLGKPDNLHLRKDIGELPWDLNDDVCKIKLWAQPPPFAKPTTEEASWLDLRGMRADQSSGLNGDYAADRAIDGDTSGQIRAMSCTHTSHGDNEAWWSVDLGRSYQVMIVKLWNRADCCGSRMDVEILVDDRLCGRGKAPQGGTMEMVCNKMGRVVKVRKPDSGVLTICEAGVKAYLPGRRLGALRPGRPGNTTALAMVSDPMASVALADRLGLRDAEHVPRRRLTPTDNALPNIGKAMFGYNAFFGAPISTENAGTDPGFRHRPLWKTSYDEGKTATSRVWDYVPGFSNERAGNLAVNFTEHVGLIRGNLESTGDKRFEKLEAEYKCAQEPDCTAIVCDAYGCKLTQGTQLYSYFGNDRSHIKVGAKVEGVPCFATVYKEDDFHGKPTTIEAGYYDYPRYSRVYPNRKVRSMMVSGGPKCIFTLMSCEMDYNDKKKVSWEPGSYKWADMQAKGMWDYFPCVLDLGDNNENGARRLAEAVFKVPDGWSVERGVNPFCDANFNTKEIKTKYDYEFETKRNLNTLGLKEIPLGPVTFSLSYEDREFQKSNAKYKKAMYMASAECVEYVAEMENWSASQQRFTGSPPPTSPEFEHVVNEIDKLNEENWFTLFDLFGTHFPTRVIFGARYGKQSMIDESSHSTLSQTSMSFNIGAEFTQEVKYSKGLSPEVTLSSTVGVEYGNEHSDNRAEKFSSYFSETKEFSVGKQMPGEGGSSAWVEEVGLEPMPIRYDLISICEHPSNLDGYHVDCKIALMHYCEKHLAKKDREIKCQPEEKQECLWDIDCNPHHTCEEGSCIKDADCFVETWSSGHFSGTKNTYGPIVYNSNPAGKVFDVNGRFSSFKISGGCDEVVIINSSPCHEVSGNNKVFENRMSNSEVEVKQWSTGFHVCKMKLFVKRQWLPQ